MSRYADEPQFTETQALLAMMSDDDDEVERLLGGMTNSELMALRTNCSELASEAGELVKDRAHGRKERPKL